jgi:hypothetical protein
MSSHGPDKADGLIGQFEPALLNHEQNYPGMILEQRNKPDPSSTALSKGSPSAFP